MRRLLQVLAAAALMIFVAMPAASAASASSGSVQPYIVVFKGTVGAPSLVAGQLGKALGFTPTFVYRSALRGFAAPLSPPVLSAIRSDSRVSFVEPDTPVQAADFAECAAPLQSGTQCVPNWALRVDAENSSTRSGDGTGSVNVNVAVLDTGIDFTHPDLNVVGGVDCTSGKGFDDPNGHGSVVAGIIGAKDNAFGVAGTAPGANLYAVRVLNKRGSGSKSGVLCGVDWVTATQTDADPANDIAVANMSLGAQGSDDGNCGNTKKDVLHQAICASTAAGVTYIVSAMNDGTDFQNTTPAAYDEVLAATAMGDSDGQPGGLGPSTCVGQADDTYAFFSNFATLAADQAHTVDAPGVCVVSTGPRGLYGFGFSGTSFASPAVAGTVALCIASGPCAGLAPAQIVQKIVSDAAAYNQANPGYGFTGDPIRPVTGKYFGYLIHTGSY